MLALLAAAALVSLPTEDGGLIWADIYGDGDRAVVLAHGGMFDKESWAAQAQQLAGAGFRVLALDFRGYGKSRGPGEIDKIVFLDGTAHAQYLFDTPHRERVMREILRFLSAKP
ncbi:MAG: alpha/beta fold hydrolase [Myxococcales bacterium]